MPQGDSFEVPEGTTILIAAVRNGVELRHDCTDAICGTDRVRILAGLDNLSPVADNEDLTLGMLDSNPDQRLGCVARILGDVTVEIAGPIG
ncbi:MAG: 2Fe-2S iron-sulfur cluster-binding protein [Alphaproteobacteria bacterium]